MPELVDSTVLEAVTSEPPPVAPPRRVWRSLRRRVGFWIAVGLLAVPLAMAIAPRAVTALSPGGDDPRACALRAADGTFRDRQLPSSDHWFGTDLQGCDEFAKVVAGARPTLTVAAIATLGSLALAILIGGVAGMGPRWADSVLSRATDVWFGFPAVIGGILLLTTLTGDARSPWEVGAVLAVLAWPVPMRIVRASVQRVRARGYVEVARTIGVSPTRTLFAHVLPNASGPVVVYAALSVGLLVTAESTLTFLGVGLDANTISWGRMIAEAEGRFESAPYLIVFPGLMITFVVLGAVLLADALRATESEAP